MGKNRFSIINNGFQDLCMVGYTFINRDMRLDFVER